MNRPEQPDRALQQTTPAVTLAASAAAFSTSMQPVRQLPQSPIVGRQAFPTAYSSMSIPEGWTDDMNISLPAGHTEDDVVDFVIQCALSGASDDHIEERLVARFALSVDDAALARDRVFGGIVRGATRNLENRPAREKDPLAWISFQRAFDDTAMVARIYPQYAQSKENQA